MTKFFVQRLAGLAIVFLLALTGCNPPNLSPSPTVQKTLTTALPTATVLSKLADTETPSPTVQIAPTVPFPTLTTYSPSAYTLQRPDFQQLVSLISAVRAQAEQNMISDDWKGQILRQSTSSQDIFITADFQRYYADNMPNASQYVENMPEEWKDLYYLPSGSIEEILFNHSLIDYFNEKQIRFVDKEGKQFGAFTVKAYVLDTYQPASQTRWLLQIDVAETRFWLVLLEDQSGKYKMIPSGMGSFSLINSSETVLTTGIDINDDQKDDVVLLKSYYFAGGMTKNLFVYTGGAQGVSLLDSIHLPKPPVAFREVYESTYQIGDYNHDGLKDIQITSPEFELFDCQWEKRLIVQFKGSKRTDQAIDGDIPHKPECTLARMMKSQQPNEQIALLQLAKTNLKQDASSDLRSWIQLRLAMLDYAQGRDQLAVQELNEIMEFPAQGKGGFQRAVQAAVQQAGSSPIRVCQILNTVSREDEVKDKTFDSDIDVDLAGFGTYPISFSPFPNIVCPYDEIINLRLKHQKLADGSSPEAAFASLGLQLSSLSLVNLDEDADPEWIGLLGVDAWKRMIVVDWVDGLWQITDQYRQYFSANAASDLQVKTQDLTGDGQPEVIISFAYDPEYQDKCSTGKNYHQLEIMDLKNTKNPELLSKTFDCVAQSPLKILSTQGLLDLLAEMKNVDPIGETTYPAWAKFQAGQYGESTDLLNDVDEIEKMVLANTQPEQAQVKIKSILDSLPANDSAADILRERLIYLSGYSYELQGNNENALATYLSLIKLNPQSLWSGLAESRLSTK